MSEKNSNEKTSSEEGSGPKCLDSCKIDNSPDGILLNLKIIGCIKKKDKVSKNEDNILEIENNDYLQSFRRWWFSRSRNETITNIRKIIEASFDITDKTLDKERTNSVNCDNNHSKRQYFDEENSNLLQRFVLEMKNASKGLDNLKITYNDDTRIVSELDILKDQLGLRIEKINGILKIDINNC